MPAFLSDFSRRLLPYVYLTEEVFIGRYLFSWSAFLVKEQTTICLLLFEHRTDIQAIFKRSQPPMPSEQIFQHAVTASDCFFEQFFFGKTWRSSF